MGGFSSETCTDSLEDSSKRLTISAIRYFGRAAIADSIKTFYGINCLNMTKKVTAASRQLADVSFRIMLTSLSLMALKMFPIKSFSATIDCTNGIIVCSITNCLTRGFLCVEAI